MEARALVGKNVRRLRVAANLSQEALGLAVECEPSYIGRIERGGENVGVDLLERIARILGLPDMTPLFVAVEGNVPRGLRSGPKPRRAMAMAPATAEREPVASAATSTPSNSDKGVEGA